MSENNFDLENKIENTERPLGVNFVSDEHVIFSVPEASSYLHLSTSFLYKLVEQKMIPHIKISKKILFSKVDLFNWARKNTVGPLFNISEIDGE